MKKWKLLARRLFNKKNFNALSRKCFRWAFVLKSAVNQWPFSKLDSDKIVRCISKKRLVVRAMNACVCDDLSVTRGGAPRQVAATAIRAGNSRKICPLPAGLRIALLNP